MAFTPGRIWPGTNLRVNVALVDSFNAPVDPTVVTFRTMDPCGSQSSYTYGVNTQVQRSGVGQYLVDFQPIEPGRWRWRWDTTSTIAAPFAVEGNFIVQDSPFSTTFTSGAVTTPPVIVPPIVLLPLTGDNAIITGDSTLITGDATVY